MLDDEEEKRKRGRNKWQRCQRVPEVSNTPRRQAGRSQLPEVPTREPPADLIPDLGRKIVSRWLPRETS